MSVQTGMYWFSVSLVAVAVIAGFALVLVTKLFPEWTYYASVVALAPIIYRLSQWNERRHQS